MKNKKLWLIIGIIIAVLVVIYIVGVATGTATVQPEEENTPNTEEQDTLQTEQGNDTNNDETTEPTQDNPSETTPEEEEDEWYSSGTYIVGKDIPAGEYVVVSSGSNCYIEVAKDSAGTLDSIISNANFSTRAYQSLIDGQYFKVRGGEFISSDKVPATEAVNGVYDQGMYKVGKDIAAGEYQVVANDSHCYIEVSENCSGTLDAIVTNDNMSLGESTYITVSDGQFLKVSGGQIQSNS